MSLIESKQHNTRHVDVHRSLANGLEASRPSRPRRPRQIRDFGAGLEGPLGRACLDGSAVRRRRRFWDDDGLDHR